LAATKADPAVQEKLDTMIAEMKAKQEAAKADIPEETDGQ
jgi:hypothetical protein